MSRELPIIYSGWAIPRLFDGSKVQTRRPVRGEKSQQALSFLLGDSEDDEGPRRPLLSWADEGHSGAGWYAAHPEYPEEGSIHLGRGYGKPGDRLWVRETWCPIPDGKPSGYFTNPKWRDRRVWYAADNDKPTWGGRWRSPLFLPRAHARVFLRIEEVRVERLQDISEADAIAEGIKRWDQGPLMLRYGLPEWCPTSRLDSARNAFAYLWESIYGRGSWNSNPWVWAYRFARLENYRAAS